MNFAKLRRLGLTMCVLGALFLGAGAPAQGATVDVGMPFTGKWAYNVSVSPPYSDANSSHPSVHPIYWSGATWSTDLYANAGTAVKLRLSNASAGISLSWGSGSGSCGTTRVINISVGGVNVGSLSFAHMSNAASTATPPTNGMTIGTVASQSCNPGPHVHFEAKSSCYQDHGRPGSNVIAEGVKIGGFSSSSFGVRQVCPNTPPPPLLDETVAGNQRNGSPLSLRGRWTTTSTGEDFAYATRRSDGGFDLAVMKQSASGLQWQGVWWSQPGVSGIAYHNTVFIPGDADGDGRMDLYYATAVDWDKPGFTVGLMRNTGSGLTWVGTQWNESSLKLGQTRFIPGDWTGNGRDAFAYVSPGPNNGFNVAVMDSTSSGLQWRGVWWSQDGNSGIQHINTKFMGSDMDGDGRQDLYYITSRDWGQPGFTMALQWNRGGGFSWQGVRWNEPNIKLGQIRFLPGFWASRTREDFAYVTPGTNSGFNVAVMASTPSGLQWQGSWWSQDGAGSIQFGNTSFSPLDKDGDGLTDLFYTTAPNWSSPGFTMAAQRNRGGGFSWWGAQWNGSLPLGTTQFIPQG